MCGVTRPSATTRFRTGFSQGFGDTSCHGSDGSQYVGASPGTTALPGQRWPVSAPAGGTTFPWRQCRALHCATSAPAVIAIIAGTPPRLRKVVLLAAAALARSVAAACPQALALAETVAAGITTAASLPDTAATLRPRVAAGSKWRRLHMGVAALTAAVALASAPLAAIASVTHATVALALPASISVLADGFSSLFHVVAVGVSIANAVTPWPGAHAHCTTAFAVTPRGGGCPVRA
mmetsp:Transcript_113453/g.315939  ORF Transcript_113453/g.315939 Transcript_113453/m.315939 type:complete len:236 (+) Transcript_113453:997-1704(+)